MDSKNYFKAFNYLNGKINQEGELLILRSKFYKHQRCVYDKNISCSDVCPMFGEPQYKNKCVIELMICQKRKLIFSNFEDER
jgi:hypothetical protein